MTRAWYATSAVGVLLVARTRPVYYTRTSLYIRRVPQAYRYRCSLSSDVVTGAINGVSQVVTTNKVSGIDKRYARRAKAWT